MPETVLAPAIVASRRRWSLAARGALALVVGFWLLLVPVGGLIALIAVWAMVMAVDALVAALAALWFYRDGGPWRLAAIQAAAGLVLASVVLGLPAPSLLSLVWLVAAWALWQGVCEVLLARTGGGGRWLGAGGAVSVVLAVILIALPVIGGPSPAIALAVYAVVRGLYLLAAAGRGR